MLPALRGERCDRGGEGARCRGDLLRARRAGHVPSCGSDAPASGSHAMSPKPRHYPPRGDEMDSAFYSTVPAADFSCFLDFRGPWFQLPGRLRRQTLRHQEAEMKLPIHCRLPALPRVSRRTAVLALIV